ncbi:MAG: 3-deoxy-7-phosphoheptulonate synthase, partial [Oligoflexus sp.]|nr:3-deoxy-7-phosphoheptulonate synthase [Oligoflexus sp.]
MVSIENTRVSEFIPLPAPVDLKAKLPAPESLLERVAAYRNELRGLLSGEDKRLLCIVG